jgi:uncharacterized membrane protein YeaQ/YmgE (transglycosylase-associated protein family)
MGILSTIFIGLLVGLVARFVKPGDDSMGWIKTILFGIGGSIAATYGGQALGLYQAGQGAGFLGSVIGAVILLLVAEQTVQQVLRPRGATIKGWRRRSVSLFLWSPP